MNFGFIVGAIVLAIVAFMVAESNEEITANMPHSSVHFASFHSRKKHQIKTLSQPREVFASSAAVAALHSDTGPALP